MIVVEWRPGIQQYLAPLVVHGLAATAVISIASWLGWMAWATLLALAASLWWDVRKVPRGCVELLVSRGELMVRSGERWATLPVIGAPWLGPGLVVVDVLAGGRSVRWWLFRGELSDEQEAALRRALKRL